VGRWACEQNLDAAYLVLDAMVATIILSADAAAGDVGGGSTAGKRLSSI